MASGSITANGAWEKLLEKYDIVNRVALVGVYHIKASEI